MTIYQFISGGFMCIQFQKWSGIFYELVKDNLMQGEKEKKGGWP